MNFVDLQDAVLFDRFDESRRADAKRQINSRYGRVWAIEPWTFKLGVRTLNVSAGSNSVAKGDLQRIFWLYDSRIVGRYTDLNPRRPEDFYRWASNNSGYAYDFTILGNNILLDRNAPTAVSLIAVGEVEFTKLVADADTPLIPESFHEILVYGTASDLLRQENDPTWTGFEQDYKAMLEDLKLGYRSPGPTVGAVPSWP